MGWRLGLGWGVLQGPVTAENQELNLFWATNFIKKKKKSAKSVQGAEAIQALRDDWAADNTISRHGQFCEQRPWGSTLSSRRHPCSLQGAGTDLVDNMVTMVSAAGPKTGDLVLDANRLRWQMNTRMLTE